MTSSIIEEKELSFISFLDGKYSDTIKHLTSMIEN